MRCLITGASGFIGSHLAEALSKRGDGFFASSANQAICVG